MAYFIQIEKTGSRQEFANKYGMTKDALGDYINILKDFTVTKGAQILYDKGRKTYYFDPPGKFTDFKFVEFD
jgi:hypothetical protein